MSVKKAARAFERRVKDEQATWPPALVKIGETALFSLNLIANNNPKTIEAIKKNVPSLWTETLNDIEKFEIEYAAFKRSGGNDGQRV